MGGVFGIGADGGDSRNGHAWDWWARSPGLDRYSASRDFRARYAIPMMPKSYAAVCRAASLKMSPRHTISKSSNPAFDNFSASSASSRAPAIQPVQSSTFLLALSGIGFSTKISATWTQPPGLRTLFNSRNTASLSGARLIAPLEMSTSAHWSSTGNSSITPHLNVTFLTPVDWALLLAFSIIYEVM